ncbi:MAG: adenosylmethionine--8-amino-7-oxononanoate transaminase [Nitrospinae bacterium]|jgi:adenosylmethionine---8-amino-7-oxononanoate aminotransferase|nr:adenosylmethionine--8-amino-7-oxononanoate transaminase [Nitrospinota bacterium]MDA1110685.1 adenosylmethionine--8-amino-7-oxononanoate transaminase [Nitrospinota bacterium]
MNKLKSKSDADLVRDLHSIWHPCTQMKDHETVPPILIERGEGVYLFDREGNKYLDVISSWWVNLLGHNHPRLNAALIRQLDKVAHVMFAGITHQPAIDLAERLVQLTPENLKKVFFSDNGSTAVEVAVKMSLQYWQQTGRGNKRKFAYLKGAYHGETLGALSLCGIDMFREKFKPNLMANIEVQGPDCFRCPYGLKPESCQAECFAPMQQTLEKHKDTLAGVIIEPLVQGAAGMKMYPPLYLKKLEKACKANDVHTIYDEIAVGFGRTGSLFVCGGYELNPTFLCLSKGITSGYLPLAATLTEDEIYSAFYGEFSEMKLFIHSHSYSANPLACAVANESLAILTENDFMETLKPKILALGKYGNKLKELKWCGEFRQTGMIAAVELVADKETKEEFPFERRVGYQIYQEGLKRGVLMRPMGNVIYFIPPLVISTDEIKMMIDTAYDCIQAVCQK